MKTLLIAGLACAALALCPRQAAAQGAPVEAVTYQQNATHTGAVEMPGFRAPLSVRWSLNLGQPISYPVIAGGKVFVTAKNASGEGYGTKLYAIDAATGAVAWGPTPLGGGYFWSALAYDQGRVYALNGDGLLRAFDAATGTMLWSAQMPGQRSFTSAPVVHDGVLYTGGAGSGGTVYAVDATTGAVLWTRSVANGDYSSPAVSDDGVYVSYSCPNVYKLDPATGTVVWQYRPGCSGGGGKTPVLAGGRLYVRDSSGNKTFDAATGAVLGTFNSRTTPAFRGNVAYFANGTSYLYSNLTIQAVDLDTGATLWTFAGDGSLRSAPFVIEDVVYVGSNAGKLFAIDATTGAELWQTSVGAPVPHVDEHNVSQPLTGFGAGEGLLVVPTDSLLVAYEPAPPAPCELVAPADVTVGTAVGGSTCGALVTYPQPASTGDCGAVTCTPASGTAFPVGTTTVTCTSVSGASAAFSVTVLDTTAPQIASHANVLANATGPDCSSVVTFAPPEATDACSTPAVVCTPPSGSAFPVGVTTVTCTASDAAGNQASTSFTVGVSDTRAPGLTGPQSMTVTTSSLSGAVVTWPLPVATDNCAGATVSCTPASGSVFPIGTTQVSCTAVDAAGGTATAYFAVTVNLNLLTNGGFDAGSLAPWGAQNHVLYSNWSDISYEGTGAVRFVGQGIRGNASLWQAPAWPAGGGARTLTFYIRITSSETGTKAKDLLYVRIANASGATLAELATFSNTDRVTFASYQRVSVTIPSAYCTGSNQIRFYATEDNARATAFYLDSIVVK